MIEARRPTDNFVHVPPPHCELGDEHDTEVTGVMTSLPTCNDHHVGIEPTSSQKRSSMALVVK